MNGVHFINYQCQKESYESGVLGMFRAFLSSTKDDMKISSIEKNRHDRIVNLKNETVFQNQASIFNRTRSFKPDNSAENGLTPYLYSFNGKNVILDLHWLVHLFKSDACFWKSVKLQIFVHYFQGGEYDVARKF